MSDTPLADALKDYYCFSHLDWYYLCCEVERENAKLHAEVKVTRQNYETYKRENAALREALVNADELERYSGSDGHRQWGKCSAWLHPDDAVVIISAKAFDAARKEEQP